MNKRIGPWFLCETNIVENQAGFCLGERHIILILRSSIRLRLESPWILSHEGKNSFKISLK